ncbi:MAG: dipeptide ABC transporter ATP-binding protein [Lautropia sp.]
MTGSTRVHGVAERPDDGRTPGPLLEVRDLRTYFDTDAGTVRAVDGVSFQVDPGETLGIVGESGSGKSVTALSIMRLLQGGSRIADGQILFGGRDVVAMDREALRALRGRQIAMVFQDPMTSLNPVRRISDQLVEAMTAHVSHNRSAALRRVITLLARMGISAPERAVAGFPHQFSGGMRQRVMLAMGFVNQPRLLLADEPTTALDVTIQAQILDLLRELSSDLGTAVILISHDLGVIANVCSRVVVMYGGEVVEEGPTEALLADPRHPYTQALLEAAPRLDRAVRADRRLVTIDGTPPDPMNWPQGCRFAERCPFRMPVCDDHPELRPVSAGRSSRCWLPQAGQALPRAPQTASPALQPDAAADHAVADGGASSRAAPLLQIDGLFKHFRIPKDGIFGPRRRVHAVDGIDLSVYRGETVGLVGESGCGKSTLARLIARILEPDAGSIRFEGREIGHASAAELRPLRRRMQMIFQDPYASLNPRMTVAEILGEPIGFHRLAADPAALRARVAELLGLVGLPASAASKYPHEFSGGPRQRISIARALAVDPDFIVADEPISALDVNIQAQIINLLIDLQRRLGLTYVVIAHDLAVVKHMANRIVVLYLGKVMEVAAAEALFASPLHPYTRSLIAAVPVPVVQRERLRLPLNGEPPDALNPPSGCRFRTRCVQAREICSREVPPLREHRPGRWAACHFAGQPEPPMAARLPESARAHGRAYCRPSHHGYPDADR